jgi:pantoate--beta-alanine ligase
LKNVYKNIEKNAELQQKRIVLSVSTTLYMDDLLTFYTVDSLQSYLLSVRDEQNVGLVPTMGALHHGHLSLVEKALKLSDIVVVSIFVNPTQFNNEEDLAKYPRTVDDDLELLSQYKGVVVIIPEVRDVYPENHVETKIHLNGLGEVLEGRFRPGHFDGVVDVVKRLFDIVLPDSAYFGEKDLQQLAVIRQLVKQLDLNVNIVPCSIIREKSGLASSSRNQRLSDEEKDKSLVIYKVLGEAKIRRGSQPISEVKSFVHGAFDNSELELEYFEIVDPLSFEILNEWKPGCFACIVAHCGQVRLLDNMQM